MSGLHHLPPAPINEVRMSANDALWQEMCIIDHKQQNT